MREDDVCFHNLEWPPAGGRVAGPVLWLRGWIVGKPGHDFVDVRVRHAGACHRGVLGLPRADLAAHFRSPRAWLPAEFIVGVPVADGTVELAVEAQEALGAWHALPPVALTVTPGGAPAPRVEGRLESAPDGTWTVRDAHHPFHGHLDLPGGTPRLSHGRAPVFGWLLDESRPLSAVLATTDALVFNHLDHSLTDDALAARVPQLPAARHARLRGEVDVPATVEHPACLRVYAVSPDGAVTLCFAQRIVPAPPPAAAPAPDTPYAAVPAGEPAARPSGRPRRLLLVVRSLWPADATLRALDLARHLVGAHAWAARIVSTEDGPLRSDFERTDVESLIVDPEPLLSARSDESGLRALEQLRRRIWWGHLDAVAVFDPLCGWASVLARRQGIPVLLDGIEDRTFEPDVTAIASVQALLRDGWREATAVCFGSEAAAQAQRLHLAGRPAVVIPQWHSPELAGVPDSASPRTAYAPLRAVDWLARRHPDVAARWAFRTGAATLNHRERRVRQDDAFNAPALSRSVHWKIEDATLCLGPLFARGPLRPVLDAAASGRLLAAPRTPTTAEWLAGTGLPLIAEDNPLAAAHALITHDAAPHLHRREAEAAAAIIRSRHNPSALIPRWAGLLAGVSASRD